MNPADYEYLSNFLLGTSGLSLGTGKEYLLEARLVPLAQSLGLNDIAELVQELKKGRDKRIGSAVTEEMTTNETSFFRDKTPFEDLTETMLPSLIKARQAKRSLRIWSAAASTGQEVYTIQMMIREFFPELRDWNIEFLATDISKQALQRAESGIYSQFEVQRGLPIKYLMTYFQQVDAGWQIKEELRQCVRWQPVNLLDQFSHFGRFDIIFCRNVLIYFQNESKKDILDRLGRVIRPDGYLSLGAAETVLGISDSFTRFRVCKSGVYTPTTAVPAL